MEKWTDSFILQCMIVLCQIFFILIISEAEKRKESRKRGKIFFLKEQFFGIMKI